MECCRSSLSGHEGRLAWRCACFNPPDGSQGLKVNRRSRSSHLERACVLEQLDDLGLGPTEQKYLRIIGRRCDSSERRGVGSWTSGPNGEPRHGAVFDSSWVWSSKTTWAGVSSRPKGMSTCQLFVQRLSDSRQRSAR